MTTISTYPVTLHTSTSKPTSDDHRLVILNSKEPSAAAKKLKPNLKKLPALCISIPAIKVLVTPTELAELLQTSFNKMQDECIRDDINRQIGEYTGQQIEWSKTFVADNVFSLTGVIEANKPQRLTLDMISSWFDTSVDEKLALAIAAKKGFADLEAFAAMDEANKNAVQTAVNQRRELLMKLSAPVTPRFNDNITEQLIKCVQLADDSNIKSNLLSKLAPKTVTVEEMNDAI